MVPRDFLSHVYFLIYSLFSYFPFFLFSLSWTYLPSHSFCLSSFFCFHPSVFLFVILLLFMLLSFCVIYIYLLSFVLSLPLFSCSFQLVLAFLFPTPSLPHIFFTGTLRTFHLLYILSFFSCFVVRVRLLLIPLQYTSHISLFLQFLMLLGFPFLCFKFKIAFVQSFN
jgi:hypothetical protein